MKKNNDFLWELSIGKLLLKMSLPATIGMLVMTLYNIVDSIFIGHYVGTLGLGAVIITFPLMMLIIALSMGFGIGASSIISLKFGEKNHDYANKVFGNFLFLIFFLGLFISIFCYIFIDKILIFFGSSIGILPYAKSYFSIIVFGIFFQMFSASTNNIIRSEGSAKTSMMIMISGAFLNIILDYIFIVYLNLGISGVAMATVISQIITFLLTISYFLFGKSILKIYLKNIIPDMKIVKNIIIIGFPSFARQSSMSIVGIVMNNSIKFYGSDLVMAGYGILFQLMMLLIMPVMGILQWTQPIVGYNYGAKKYLRIKEVLKLSIKSSTIIITTTYILIMYFPELFIRLFTSDIQLIEITKHIAKIMLFMMPVIAFQFIVGGFFQSIGKAKPALIVSLLRQFILLLPMILILPLFFGLDGLWYSYPIADFFSLFLVYYIFKKEYDKLETKEKNILN